MDNRPLGIFDSGLGGLTVAKEIYRLLPEESTIYVGDTARVPYGNRSQKIVTQFSRQIVDFLITQNVKGVIVACSTATSQALPTLQKLFNVPIYGVIEPAASEALQTTKNNHIGIIGTRGTIESKIFQKLLLKVNPKISITTQTCPLFVPLAEEGITRGKIAEAVASLYLQKFRQTPVDTLILGCTHYPLLELTIQKVVGNSVKLINPGLALAQNLKLKLTAADIAAPSNNIPFHHYFVTDNPDAFTKHAREFLGTQLNSQVKLLSLSESSEILT